VTGCGCLAVIAAIVALLVIFIRGSFDAGEPIEQAIALAITLAITALAGERWQWERPADQLVRARGA
jgi:hypothetical protein